MFLLLSVNRSSYTDNTAKITNIQLIHFIYLFIYVFIIFTSVANFAKHLKIIPHSGF